VTPAPNPLTFQRKFKFPFKVYKVSRLFFWTAKFPIYKGPSRRRFMVIHRKKLFIHVVIYLSIGPKKALTIFRNSLAALGINNLGGESGSLLEGASPGATKGV